MEVRSGSFTLIAALAAIGATMVVTHCGGASEDLVQTEPEASLVRIGGCEISALVQRSEVLFLDVMPEGLREQYLLNFDVSPSVVSQGPSQRETIVVFFSLSPKIDASGERITSHRGGGGPEIRFDPGSCDLVSWHRSR